VVLGQSVRVGYLAQARENLDDEASIFENVIGNRASITLGEQSLTPDSYLRRFQFSAMRGRDKVGLLSGGERARVALAQLLAEPLNLLLLDEPTNDLDVQTLSSLEEMLLETDTTCIVVTHDRYFLDRVTTAVLTFSGSGKVERFADSSQALRALAEEERNEKKSESPKKKVEQKKSEPGPKKLTYAESIELSEMMPRIEASEAEVARVQELLADPNLYAERGAEVPALQEELRAKEAELAALLERWEHLEERSNLT
jgi:ATP-binding cassette subfamily F protein uup